MLPVMRCLLTHLALLLAPAGAVTIPRDILSEWSVAPDLKELAAPDQQPAKEPDAPSNTAPKEEVSLLAEEFVGGPETRVINGTMVRVHGGLRVVHKEFLNHESFWWLMGSLILLVGIGVVGLETQSTPAAAAGSTAEVTTASESEAPPATTPGQPSRVASFFAAYSASGDGTLHLVFCVVMINLSMLLWGICQEFVTTTVYRGKGTAEQVPSSLLLVFFNRLTSIIFATVLLRLLGKPLYFPGFFLGSMPGITNCLASWCQYSSLSFISFALQSTAKSAKLLPVIAIGSLRGKKYKVLDYAEALVIVSGLIVFATETDAKNQPFSVTEVGAVLLILYIVLDSITPHLQDHAFKHFPEVDPLQGTLAMCCAAGFGTAVLMLINGSIWVSVGFLWRHPIALLHMLVLSLSSTVSQYMMVYTVKYFGPTVLTLIVATRQMISVLISDFLFQHQMTVLAVISALMVLGAVVIRALRIMNFPDERRPATPQQLLQRSDSQESELSRASGQGEYRKLLICTVGIHVLYCFYCLTQEFLATHTFKGELFTVPMFVIAVNHTWGALFALANLRLQKMAVITPGMWLTAFPAVADLVATYFQHKALYFIYFPAQTLLKTLKLIPVMLVGRLLKNRTYTWLDYLEGALISGLVAFFVWDFQLNYGRMGKSETTAVSLGILMMLGYIASDSFLSNLEDYVYQASAIDPAQMLFGLELLSGLFAWASLFVNGGCFEAIHFLATHTEALIYIALQAWASAAGAYTCTLTVRLYGPAVFTLLMMSRQVFSLMLSVTIFGHSVNTVSCLCLVVVAFLILTSSLRRVTVQLSQSSKSA